MADADELGTTTFRIRNDLAEMIREICFYTRDANGKRVKATDFLDSLLREPVRKKHVQVMSETDKQRKRAKDA